MQKTIFLFNRPETIHNYKPIHTTPYFSILSLMYSYMPAPYLPPLRTQSKALRSNNLGFNSKPRNLSPEFFRHNALIPSSLRRFPAQTMSIPWGKPPFPDIYPHQTIIIAI